MSHSSNAFVERAVFERYLGRSASRSGEPYQDLNTIHGDLSRLVVAWLARTPPKEIAKMYNELGWAGSCNARAVHEATKAWMREHRPEGISEAAPD